MIILAVAGERRKWMSCWWSGLDDSCKGGKSCNLLRYGRDRLFFRPQALVSPFCQTSPTPKSTHYLSILSMLRRPCQVSEAMAVDDKTSARAARQIELKHIKAGPMGTGTKAGPMGTGLWDYCGIRMEVMAGKRKRVVKKGIASHSFICPPNNDEKSTSLESGKCGVYVHQGNQISFCQIDKALLNSIT